MVLIENIMRFVTLRLFRVTVALSLPVSALASDAIEHEAMLLTYGNVIKNGHGRLCVIN